MNDLQINLTLNNFLTLFAQVSLSYSVIVQLEEELIQFRLNSRHLKKKFLFALFTNLLGDFLLKRKQVSVALSILEDSLVYFESAKYFDAVEEE